MLTGHWLRCDRTLERSTDRTLKSSVRSTPVRFQRRESVTGRVRSVLTGPWGFSVRSSHFITGLQVELIGVSGQHDRSVRSPRRST